MRQTWPVFCAALLIMACGEEASGVDGGGGQGAGGAEDGGRRDDVPTGGGGASAGSAGAAGSGASAGSAGAAGTTGRDGSAGGAGSAGIGGASGTGPTDARAMDVRSEEGGARDATSDAGDGGIGLGCDALPVATGTIINVTPAETAQLPAIVAGAPSGSTILLADGMYSPVARLNLLTPGVTLRSASGNAAAAVLDGAYATDEIVFVGASNVTVAEITVTRAVHHPIHVSPPDTGPDVTGVRLYRLRVIDGGEQFVKVNPNGARTHWVDGGKLECSLLLMTDAGRPHVVALPGLPCYTGGIDAHAARGWVVRRNRIEGLWCPTGLSEHAIHFWSASRDTVSENNVIVNCAMGIGYGLGEMGTARAYADNPYPGAGYIGHYDGIIRNNVIYADVAGFDTGIALEQARGVRVFHNTIFSTDAATAFFSSIDYRFANTVAEIRNNLCRRVTMRSGAMGMVDHNLESVPASYFVNASGQDFRLTAAATGAIDQGLPVAEAGLDMDGIAPGAPPDLGAYQFRP